MSFNNKNLLIIACCLLNVIGIWLALAIQIRHDHTQTRRASETIAYNLARAFEEHVSGEVRDIDKLLLYLRAKYLGGMTNFNRELKLIKRLGHDDMVLQIALYNSQGLLVHYDHYSPADPSDIGTNELFLAQKNSSNDRLLISKPTLGNLPGKGTIQFIRKITSRENSFGGVIVASVPTAVFSDFFQSVDIGTKGAITLFGTDGVIRARASGVKSIEEANGINISPDHPAIRLRTPSGIYSAKCVLDGESRLSAYRKLERHPLVVQVGLSEEDIFKQSHTRRNSMLLIGVLILGAFTGALFFLLRFEQQQQNLAQKISIRDKELQVSLNELELLVTTDPLTGLPNRRSFFSRAQTEFTRSMRYNRNLTLIMVDVDHFKDVNDRHGHLIGDAALVHISEIMKRCMRESDMVARYGGEEFVIMFPETDKEGAHIIAERMRSEIESSPFNAGSGINLILTVSMGIACVSAEHELADVDKLLQYADDAMYRAKSNGRNCIALHSTSPESRSLNESSKS